MSSKGDRSARETEEAPRDLVEYMKDALKVRQDPLWAIQRILGVQRLFPAQRDIIATFYQHKYNPALPRYRRFVGIAGMRSGKTAVVGMMAAYEYINVAVLPSPSKYYKLLTNQEIFVSVIAPSEKQALDGVFGNVQNLIEGSEWISTWLDLRIKSDRIEYPKKQVTAQTLGSWASTAVGRSNICVAFDEIDTFEDTSSKRGAWEVWSRLTKSTDTFGEDGKQLAITSPRHPTSIGMTLYKNAASEPATFAILKPTWEMNPNLTKEALMEEHKYDLATFWRDYGCQPELWSGVQFPEGVTLTRMPNVLQGGVDPTKCRVLAIDPAVKNDSFGMACGYLDLAANPVVDGVIKFRKSEGDVFLRPSEIRDFLDRIIPALGINILIHDTWMFPELIEYVQTKYGVMTVKHIVRKEDYDRWREMQSSGTVKVVHEEELKKEAERLIVVNEKNPRTDHPFGGSKDMSDCVANVIWYLTTQEMVSLDPGLVMLYVI